ncbi:hypothetical protein [Streptomyces filamentosus]|uniref:hypothetical protein n=1 Tax=Streptomyces filamentosus TaxID=67294 RepID=UPI0033296392
MDAATGHWVATLPFFAGETVTIDHGDPGKKHNLVEAEWETGWRILPARVLRQTDEFVVGRQFLTVQAVLFEHLLGFTGAVANRGAARNATQASHAHRWNTLSRPGSSRPDRATEQAITPLLGRWVRGTDPTPRSSRRWNCAASPWASPNPAFSQGPARAPWEDQPWARREGRTGCDDAPVSHFSYVSLGPGHDWQDLPEPRQAEPGQWPKLEAALAVVNRDLRATLPGQGPLILLVAPPGEPSPPSGVDRGQVYVAMPDGRWHGNPVNACDLEEGDPPEPDDPATVLTVVADAAQETVTELLWQAWPVCGEHGMGMHPRPPGTSDGWYPGETDAVGPPVWWCRGGRDGDCHDASPVGELTAAPQGKQHRELRHGERERDGRP